MGLPPEEDEPEAPASAEVEPETTESQKQEESEPKPNPEPPKKTQIRPWDIGKEGVKDVMSQEEWVKKKRTERPQEFAPPPSYQPDFVPNPSELQPERPKVTLFFSSKKPTQEEGSASVTPDKKLWSDSDAATRTSVNRPGFKRKYPKIEDLQKEEKEEERGRGTEIPPPPTFDYYGPSSSTQGASRNVSVGNKDLESSITAGLKYLRQQAEERESQKEKGLLDII